MKFLLPLALAAVVLAQIEHPFSAFRPGQNLGIQTVTRILPAMDIDAEVKAAEDNSDLTKIWEFGKINNVTVNFFKDAAKTVTSTGTAYSLTFHMENALSMAFFFSEFRVPEGGAVFFVSERDVAGAFTHLTRWDSGAFQTRHISGNQVTVQYFETFEAAQGKEQAVLNLELVTTAFRNADDYFLKRGPCNINTACTDPSNTCTPGCVPTARTCSVACTYFNQRVADGQWAGVNWNDEVRGVVALARNANSRYCSGSFINNENRRQYVLTAAHCGPGVNDLVQIGFENPSCPSTSNSDGETRRTAGNLRRLARNVRVDNELIEVGEIVPREWNVYLAGYEAGDQGRGATGVVGIHHPAGSNKKISNSDVTVTPSAWSGTAPPLDHWRVATWSEATTEPGSSGSPLYARATKRIIGQLHGGSAACPARNGWDSYGAVWAGYTTGGMQQFLGPINMDGRPLYANEDEKIEKVETARIETR